MADYCSILRSHKPTDTLNVSILRFADKTVLEGQINGRALAVSMSFAQELGSEVAQGTGTTGEFYLHRVCRKFRMTAARSPWKSRGMGADRRRSGKPPGATLTSPPPRHSPPPIWMPTTRPGTKSGVFFAASSDMGRTGGYMQLLEGVQDWYKNDCRLDSPKITRMTSTKASTSCGRTAAPTRPTRCVLTARPIQNKTDFLILLDMRITKDADLEALDHILNTFVVKGDV